MSLPAAVIARVAQDRLIARATAPVLPEDGLAPDLRSVILLAPDEPAFWPHFTASPEYGDGAPAPLDRWSRRIIGKIACDLGAKAVFPFGGPPWRPFPRWALRSGQVWTSPVGLLVDAHMGLFVSFRGAIALREAVAPPAGTNPCNTCAGQPCRSACPVGALTAAGYDVPTCHAHLDQPEGADCQTRGCAVRRACPVGLTRRLPAQSAFHMKAFHTP